MSDEARSDPVKMIIHRIRTALISATAVAIADAAERGIQRLEEDREGGH